MSKIKTIYGVRHIEGGGCVQLLGDDKEYIHLHFDGNTSLNGATATLRSKGWIEKEDEVVAIRSCQHGQEHEVPVGHLVAIKRKERSQSLFKDGNDVTWDEIITTLRRTR